MEENNNNIISGFKFAEISDVIFSGVFLKSQINMLKLQENVEQHIGDKEYFFVRKKYFTLKENDIIFCKTEYVKELFNVLNKQCKFKNIKLITHQSDLKITKKIYKLKPKCISKWFSINVDYADPDLIPIPLGVANFHSKNLNENSFKNKNLNFFSEKTNLLYLNFNPNTNFQHRKSLYNQFKNEEWVDYDELPILKREYQQKISQHKFTLAPWGNGIDTHRFWEALYSGSIPVTKKHIIYSSFKTLPVLLVDNYNNISKTYLNEEFKKLTTKSNELNLDELNFEFWKKKISQNRIILENENAILLNNKWHYYYRYSADFKHVILSKLKIFNRIRRFIYKKLGF